MLVFMRRNFLHLTPRLHTVVAAREKDCGTPPIIREVTHCTLSYQFVSKLCAVRFLILRMVFPLSILMVKHVFFSLTAFSFGNHHQVLCVTRVLLLDLSTPGGRTCVLY